MRQLNTLPPVLPCYPCPHASACCAYGVDLTDTEAKALSSDFVVGTPGTFRTAVQNGACVFLVDNACLLHDTPSYPSVCAGFPWRSDTSDDPYEGDLSICPELVGSRE